MRCDSIQFDYFESCQIFPFIVWIVRFPHEFQFIVPSHRSHFSQFIFILLISISWPFGGFLLFYFFLFSLIFNRGPMFIFLRYICIYYTIFISMYCVYFFFSSSQTKMVLWQCHLIKTNYCAERERSKSKSKAKQKIMVTTQFTQISHSISFSTLFDRNYVTGPLNNVNHFF